MSTNEKDKVIAKIKTTVEELDVLFEKASEFDIRFDCHFSQSASFGKGKRAILKLSAYDVIF